MRRVDHVRVSVLDGHVVCVAVGVGHRLPAERWIPRSTAIRLRRTGVAIVFDDSCGPRRDLR